MKSTVTVFWQETPGHLPVFIGGYKPWRLPDKDGRVAVSRHNTEFAVDPTKLRYADSGAPMQITVPIELTPSAAVGTMVG